MGLWSGGILRLEHRRLEAGRPGGAGVRAGASGRALAGLGSLCWLESFEEEVVAEKEEKKRVQGVGI